MNISESKRDSEEERELSPASFTLCRKSLTNVSRDNFAFSSFANERNDPDHNSDVYKSVTTTKRFDEHGQVQMLSKSELSITPLTHSVLQDLTTSTRLTVREQYGNSNSLSPISGNRQPSIPERRENERLSITIPQVAPDICGGISPSPSLLMTSTSHCLTPSSPASGNLSLSSPSRHDFVVSGAVNKVLFEKDDSYDEEKIDVCTVKDTQSVVNCDKKTNENEKEHSLHFADEDERETNKKDETTLMYSYLGSQCSRTVPSLMKFYSRHKRSLSTSLSVTLAVSGQSTPPCSPISPGTMSVLPSLPKRSLEVSTMTSPTDQTFHSLIPTEQQKYDVENSQTSASSSLAALTLLTIPNMSAEKPVNIAKLSPIAATRMERKLNEGKQVSPRDDESEGISIPCPPPPAVSIENSSVDTPVCTIPPGISFSNPWSIPHNTIPHPGSYWLHSGMDAGPGLNLGYHVARDPLTGHLFLLSRPHPLADPNGHGLVWAGYGGVPAPPLMMPPQQLLLDPRYRSSLHHPPPHPPPPSIMQMHHTHPALHPQHHQQQQQQSPKNTNVSNKETSKKSPIPISDVNNQATDIPLQTLPPPTISPHFLYPPTTIPYYYSQPTHPNPFNLSAYAQRTLPAPSLGLPSPLQSNLLTPLTSNLFTASSSTLTTTTSESILISEKRGINDVSDSPGPKDNVSHMRNRIPNFEPNISLASDPKINPTDHLSMKSCLYEVRTSSEEKCSSHKEDSLMPSNVHIKEEIKEEESVSCCISNKECKRHISANNFFCLKVESSNICTHSPDDAVSNMSTRSWESAHISKHIAYKNESSDIQQLEGNTKLMSSNEINNSVDLNLEQNLNTASSVQKNAIDSSGLELLLQTFLQHGDRLAPSPQAKDSDQESLSSLNEQMPHLERVTSTPSPRVSPASFESQPPVLTPFTFRTDTESPPLPSSSTDQKYSSREVDPKPLYLPPKPSGLSVLCALAEQRILEEQQNSCSALSSLAEVASSSPSVIMNPLSLIDLSQQSCSSNNISEILIGPVNSNADVSLPIQEEQRLETINCTESNSADINRNYKCHESESEVQAFLTNEVSQFQNELSPDVDTTSTCQMETMKAVETDMKLKIADLQRQFKLKQMKLSRLQPKKDFSINVRRRRGRPPKIRNNSSIISGIKRKARKPFKNTELERFSSVLQNTSDDIETRLEAQDDSTFMQTTSLSSMQTQTQSNIIPNSWQPKLEDSSDEDETTTFTSNSHSLETCCPSTFKSPYLTIHTKQEEPEEDHIVSNIQQDKCEKVETSVESSTSDAEFHSLSSSSSKKRKPGRPKKHSPTKFESTETIVAKKPKGFEFLLVSHKTKIRPKLKAELKIRNDQEDEIICNKSQAFNSQGLKEETEEVKDGQSKASNAPKEMRRRGAPMGRSSLSRNNLLRDKEKRKSVFEKNSRMQELFRSLKRHSTIAAAEHDESEDEKDEKEYKPLIPEKKEDNLEEELPNNNDLNRKSPVPDLSNEQIHKDSKPASDSIVSSEESEKSVKAEPNTADDFSPSIPKLILNLNDETSIKVKEETCEEYVETNDSNDDKESSFCSLQVEDLVRGTRLLILQDGLLYAGSLSPITPPDVYGIHIDGERGTRPHIYCQEDLLTQAWKEVKPGSTRFLTEGTRVCAFWSQQYRGLYPGCVAAACSPTHEGNHNLVNVEFDDGDSGRIHVDDIRLLPHHFPIIEYDPNPLMTLNKRKRRLTEESSYVQHKSPKLSLKVHHSIGVDTSMESNKTKKNSLTEGEKSRKDSPSDMGIKKEPKRKQKRKRVQKRCFISREDRKRHKKRKKSSDSLFKHKHKRKHKRKRKSGNIFPHVEQGDTELRMRIKSPPPLKEESVSHEETSTEDEMVKSESEEPSYQPQRRKKRSPSEKSKIAPFLLERQLWRWFGKGYRRPGSKGKGKKLFYKEIVRGKEHIRVGDCAVFLSSGSHERPFIGKIDFLWEGWGGNMVVKVRWFYHPDETIGTERKLSEPKGALFSSSHTDENDVQTISHKCHVISLADYRMRRAEFDRKYGQDYENFDLYYLAGFYDPTYSRITMEPGVS